MEINSDFRQVKREADMIGMSVSLEFERLFIEEACNPYYGNLFVGSILFTTV